MSATTSRRRFSPTSGVADAGGFHAALYFCSLAAYLHAMELGEKIKKVRGAAGLNQKQVAERAGVDPGILNKIEKRGQNLSLEILRRIASGIGCSVVDLLPDDVRQPQRASATKATRSRGGRM